MEKVSEQSKEKSGFMSPRCSVFIECSNKKKLVVEDKLEDITSCHCTYSSCPILWFFFMVKVEERAEETWAKIPISQCKRQKQEFVGSQIWFSQSIVEYSQETAEA
ncbi:hypothetical protein Leryth_023585 [Lithospermum erythrorhizon]|nr:hypothetical protein Leryth_023585 [Lithospermum erythrorhizon]